MEALSPLSVENRSVENADLLKFLRTAVETMPLQQRQVMLLRHWGDYSLTEIEELTGLSAANVRVLLSRGRKKLRELLTNEKL
jgi:RNA polymerase sigma-70 factor (ECF subfamily)